MYRIRFAKLVVLLLVFLAVAVLFSSVALACPNCKNTLAQNDSQQRNLAAGYYYSILFMLSMPFLIAGTFGGCMYLAVRRARKAESGERRAESTNEE